MPAIQLYDWDKWLAYARFSLAKGKHYDCSTVSMAQQVRNAARVRDKRVSIVETDTGLNVTVRDKEVRDAV